jgi:hypothetical protein
VEKVVKPPHKPVVSNRHQGLERVLYLLNDPYNMPMTKQPRRLTVRVPQGNPWWHTCFIQVEMPNLNAPPIKLPMPTIRNDFIMMIGFIFCDKVRKNMLFVKFLV